MFSLAVAPAHTPALALSLQVDVRLARHAFNQFIQQSVINNLLRRRGYLASVRHVRLLTFQNFGAWRWAHFAARWLPLTDKADASRKSVQSPTYNVAALLDTPVATSTPARTPWEGGRERWGRVVQDGAELNKLNLSTRHALAAMTENLWKNDHIKETGCCV